MFSKACEYGIKATIYIGQQSDEGYRVSLKAVAKAIDSPIAFTAKILQALAKDGIINSTKGPAGGYRIVNLEEDHITLLNIVSAIDGDSITRRCGLGLEKCNASKPCPLHDQFAKIRSDLTKMLSTTTIQDLAVGLKEEAYFLKR